MIVSKVYRRFVKGFKSLKSDLRIFHIKLMYPQIQFIGNCVVGKGCWIMCEDNSKVILDNVIIEDYVVIQSKHGGQISIKNSFIGTKSTIVSFKSIEIGRNCLLAEMVVIRDQNHKVAPPEMLLSERGYECSDIKIGNNVWLGAKSTVLKGVEIGDNSVIGAHALVNSTISESKVAVGIPAKEINRSA